MRIANYLYLFFFIMIMLVKCDLFDPEEKNGSLRITTTTMLATLSKVQVNIYNDNETIYHDEISVDNNDFYHDIEDLESRDNYTVFLYGKNAEDEIVLYGSEANIRISNDTQTVITIEWHLFTPTLISPTNSSILNTTQPKLLWNRFSNATHYQLKVSEDSTFNNSLIETETTDTAYIFNQPLNKTLYFWQVRCQDTQGIWGNWSTTWRFLVSHNIVATPTFAPHPEHLTLHKM